ncbi:hypothetical protein ANME2D_03257 [Candidatus Methanoperedens nitroreducens]|uniref:DUF4367 domain-containing protein n=1 Tax=Candidatus Methanoperedens nitratireducens TaxID=1392998 RepID=A0A062V1F7_9EURY|nr:hypothetical protein [Candidatus Methanoperedens nitroreducens]KCZ71222.1 hypothetical protein ANME2D_03257 [Candidatus Methanoperedens nitroreducens]MDJ1421396.1 hypothetical protein [Candidatus Methanoperedens sp.]
MSKKIILLLALFLTAVFVSGCISGRDDNPTSASDYIPQTDLPAGFTYMGTHETEVDIGGSLMNATEGVYRYDSDDIYIQVIEDDNPEALISKYKLRYKDANYDPFQEISFNGHRATQVTDYPTIGGSQKAHYTIIWSAKESMVIVGSSPNAQTVIALATATGY